MYTINSFQQQTQHYSQQKHFQLTAFQHQHFGRATHGERPTDDYIYTHRFVTIIRHKHLLQTILDILRNETLLQIVY